MKKRIAILLATKPQDGGQHQYALLIVECLLDRSDEYDLLAFCGNDFWKEWCEERTIRHLRYPIPAYSMREQQFNEQHPFWARLYYTYMTAFGRKVMEEKIDLLFSTHQGIFLPNYKVKIIAPVHDLMHRYESRFPEVRESYASREITMKCLARYAACVLVDSNLGRKQFRESYGVSKHSQLRIERLPYVVPEYIWSGQEECIEVPDKYIFYPAQFWKHKNHINLLKAIRLLKDDIVDLHLVLVGSEKNNCKDIKQYISHNNLQKNVTILGFVSNENVIYLYRHAVGLIMPSYFGPTNIPPLEAMALGCPVAVSRKYAMPEQVGKAGLLFDPDSPEEIAECIRTLWLDNKLRHKMQKYGTRRVQKWTNHEFGEKLCGIVNEIIVEKKKGKM